MTCCLFCQTGWNCLLGCLDGALYTRFLPRPARKAKAKEWQRSYCPNTYWQNLIFSIYRFGFKVQTSAHNLKYGNQMQKGKSNQFQTFQNEARSRSAINYRVKLVWVQVNLCKKLFLLQNMGRTVCVQKLFWISETISLHNMFSAWNFHVLNL